ncbi:MAG: glucose-6-phosphate isomerase, partial [Phycisphaerales bacterium]|nr:glucose-6-phosphate isomerase [Phycisphaerales bacterium]
MNKAELWKRYRSHLCVCESIDLTLDISRMSFDDGFFDSMAPSMATAHADMVALEAGAIANPDENRMVGHYWLRAPELAPSSEITQEIESTLTTIKAFVAKVHNGELEG